MATLRARIETGFERFGRAIFRNWFQTLLLMLRSIAGFVSQLATSTTAPQARRDWLVPACLILLSAVPVAAGAIRLAELTAGAEVTPDNARFFAAPLPVVLHVLSVTLYAVLGAFQFSPGLRRRSPRWHRTAGLVLVPCGIVAAASGLWMQAFYQLPEYDGELLAAFRVLFGSAMLVSILLGVTAMWRRDFVRHGAWMLRGYSIGMGAGTQVLTNVPWVLLVGPPDELPRALLMGAGWVINLAVAEHIIRRRSTLSPAHPRAVVRPQRRRLAPRMQEFSGPQPTEVQ